MFTDYDKKRMNALSLMDKGVDSSGANVDDYLELRDPEMDYIEEDYTKDRQSLQYYGDGAKEMLAGYDSWDHNLEAELQAESDAIEEMESKVQIRLMVAEAVWRGLVRAVEEEARRTAEVKELELSALKKELQDKDSIVEELIEALKKKEEDLSKMVECRHEESEGKPNGEAKASKEVSEINVRSPRLLQGEVGLLNCKIQELESAHSILIQEIKNYKEEIEAQHGQLIKQGVTIHNTEQRCKTMQDDLHTLHSKLIECEIAAQLKQVEKDEQGWTHEAEVKTIMTVVEGRMMDLVTELSSLEEDISRNNVPTVALKSDILQRLSSELKHLRSSKAALETKLEDSQAVVRFLEESMENQRKRLESELTCAESMVSLLEQKLSDNDTLLRTYRSEMLQSKKSEENLKERCEELERRVESVKEEQVRLTHMDQQHRMRGDHLQDTVDGLEEMLVRLEFEKRFISTYMDNAFQESWKYAAEISRNSTTDEERGQQSHREVDAGSGYLSQRRDDVEGHRVEKVIHPDVVRKMQMNIKEEVDGCCEARNNVHAMIPESEELKAVGDKHDDDPRKDREAKLSRKEEAVTDLLTTLEEIKWTSQVEMAIVLGCVEGLCQNMTEKFQEVLEFRSAVAVQDVKLKNRRVTELEEVTQAKEEVLCLRGDTTTVRKQINAQFNVGIETLFRSLQQLEGAVSQKTEVLTCKLQRCHNSLRELHWSSNTILGKATDHGKILRNFQNGTDARENLRNLQKAEAEVDFLGDEVDALMDLLEKVYTVLSHYHPVIQHYPGLADLTKVVRGEVLQRIAECDDV